MLRKKIPLGTLEGRLQNTTGRDNGILELEVRVGLEGGDFVGAVKVKGWGV